MTTRCRDTLIRRTSTEGTRSSGTSVAIIRTRRPRTCLTRICHRIPDTPATLPSINLLRTSRLCAPQLLRCLMTRSRPPAWASRTTRPHSRATFHHSRQPPTAHRLHRETRTLPLHLRCNKRRLQQQNTTPASPSTRCGPAHVTAFRVAPCLGCGAHWQNRLGDRHPCASKVSFCLCHLCPRIFRDQAVNSQRRARGMRMPILKRKPTVTTFVCHLST